MRKYYIDIDLFKTINKQNAYILGFIAADGCVYKKNNNNVLVITLSMRDESHLLKIKEAANQSDIKTQEKIFANIGTYYLGSEMSDSAKLYFQKGLKLAQKSKSEYFKAICLMGLARINGHFAEYDEGISNLNQALVYAIKSDSSELVSNIYRIYGNIYWGFL